MRVKIIQHVISILFIAIIFMVSGYYLSSPAESEPGYSSSFSDIEFVNWNDPLEKTIFHESLDFFFPAQTSRNDSIMAQLSGENLTDLPSLSTRKNLTLKKFKQIMIMYAQFILVYLIVLIFTYYGAQSLAIFRFVKFQQKRSSYLESIWNYVQSKEKKSIRIIGPLIVKSLLKGILIFILFSPAYVIAYSIKTRFDTDSIFFMILLGILSNGLLISYTQKFYTFLTAENKKGYIQTAKVKNLLQEYHSGHHEGISYKNIFKLHKSFDGHILQHIFINARFQNLASIKEQASFLISGLVIIEMALNIQGHLCYELLQNILYQNYQTVLLIVFCIFLLLKLTEIVCDFLIWNRSQKYENIT